MLLIGAGLVLTLFNEAQAVTDLEWSTAPTSVAGSGTFVMDIRVQNGQVLPIERVEAIVEEKNSLFSDHRGKSVVAAAECVPQLGTPGSACPLTTSGSKSGGISSITFVNAYGVEPTDGPADAYVIQPLAFAQDCATTQCDFHGSPYGYDDFSPQFQEDTNGYGYGIDTGGFGNAYSLNTGYGYGYLLAGTADLVLRFQVAVSGNVLGSGTHYLTFRAHTGDDVAPYVSSPFTEFTSSISGGGGGGGGGGGPGSGPATVTVTATLQADGSYLALVTANQGDTVIVNFPANTLLGEAGSPLIVSLEFTADVDMTNAQITLTPRGNAPPGNVPITPGTVFGYFDLTITDASGNAIDTGQITIKFQVPSLGNAQTTEILLMHHKDNAWEDKATRHVSGDDFEADIDDLSPFAIVADLENPTVTLSVPSGDLEGAVSLTATATDNIRVTKVDFFDGTTLIGSDSTAPFEVSWNTAAVTAGSHTIRAVATDVVGHTSEDSKPASVAAQEGQPGPGPEEEKGGLPGWVWVLIILALIAVIGGAAWYFSQQKGGTGGQGGAGAKK